MSSGQVALSRSRIQLIFQATRQLLVVGVVARVKETRLLEHAALVWGMAFYKTGLQHQGFICNNNRR